MPRAAPKASVLVHKMKQLKKILKEKDKLIRGLMRVQRNYHKEVASLFNRHAEVYDFQAVEDAGKRHPCSCGGTLAKKQEADVHKDAGAAPCSLDSVRASLIRRGRAEAVAPFLGARREAVARSWNGPDRRRLGRITDCAQAARPKPPSRRPPRQRSTRRPGGDHHLRAHRTAVGQICLMLMIL